MANRLKMDFYRLLRSPLFYILIGATVLFTIYMMGTFMFLDFTLNNLDTQALDDETMGLIVGIMPSDFKSYLELFFIGNFFIVFLVIFAVVFSSAEYKSGYIKNTSAYTSPRYLSYFSNLIIVTVFTAILFLVGGIIVSIGGIIMDVIDFNKSPELIFDYIKSLIPFMTTKFLSNVSLTAFFLMIFYLLRNATPVMISGLTYTMLGTALFGLINVVIAAAFNKADFDISLYTNLGNMTYVGIGADTSDIVRSIIVSVVILGISTFVSCFTLQKKDVR